MKLCSSKIKVIQKTSFATKVVNLKYVKSHISLAIFIVWMLIPQINGSTKHKITVITITSGQ